MKNMKRFALYSLTVIMLAACSPQIRVYSDSDPDYDLWTYKSFDWGQRVDIEAGRNPLQYNELNDKRIKTAVRDQLESRGYVFQENDSELMLHYHIIVDNKSAIVPEPYGYRYGSYFMRSGANVHYYREGTLILDLMERNTGNLIWRGWAVADIDNIEPEEVDKVIKQAVERIFTKFPAKKR